MILPSNPENQLKLNPVETFLFHAYEQAFDLATHDNLTGLPNREGQQLIFDEFVAQNKNFAVVLIDISSFGVANNRVGYDQGDEILKDVSVCLTKTVRNQDVVARNNATRLGGDEFLLFFDLDDYRIDAEAEIKNDRRETIISQPLTHSQKTVKLAAIKDNVLHSGKTCPSFVNYNQRDDVPASQELSFYVGGASYEAGDTFEDIKIRANIEKNAHCNQEHSLTKLFIINSLKRIVMYLEK